MFVCRPPSRHRAQEPLYVTAQNVLRGVNNITNEEYNRRFNMFGIQFALQDIDRFSPTYLNGIKNELKKYLLNKFFDGEAMDEEQMENVSRIESQKVYS